MGYREQLEAGHGAFAAMLKAWHERNSWSHRVLPALAEQLDFGRLHSSQLSNLRNRKLASMLTVPDPPSNGKACVRAPESPGTATIAVGAPSPPAADG